MISLLRDDYYSSFGVWYLTFVTGILCVCIKISGEFLERLVC